MRKITLVVVFALASLSAFAQKPAQGDMGFTFGLNGLANIGVNAGVIPTGTLLFRYYFSDNMAGRLGVNFGMGSTTVEDNSDTADLVKTVTKSNTWALNIGLQKSMGDNEKLEPYAAVDLWVGGGKSGDIDETHTLSGGAISETHTEPGGSFSFGLTPIIGVNWFVMKQMAIGAEFGWGLNIGSTGEGTVTSTFTSGGTTNTVVTKSASSSSFNLGGHASGLITASFFFTK